MDSFETKEITSIKFYRQTTGELMGAIKDVTDVDLKEVDNEYTDIDFDITFPNGSRYKGVGKVKKSEFEALYKVKRKL